MEQKLSQLANNSAILRRKWIDRYAQKSESSSSHPGLAKL